MMNSFQNQSNYVGEITTVRCKG